jgi:hypothetical protein
MRSLFFLSFYYSNNESKFIRKKERKIMYTKTLFFCNNYIQMFIS